MKVKRIGDSWCIYELPFKPGNPARPAFVVASRRGCDGFSACVVSNAGDGLRKALVRCGSQCPETYVGEAWVATWTAAGSSSCRAGSATSQSSFWLE